MPERRRDWVRWLVLILAVVLAGAFAYLNSGERVSLHFGLFVLYRLPLAVVLFIAFLLGMGMMFLVGLRHDLRVRRLLREYRIQEERRPWQSVTRPEFDPPPVPSSLPPRHPDPDRPDGESRPVEAPPRDGGLVPPGHPEEPQLPPPPDDPR